MRKTGFILILMCLSFVAHTANAQIPAATPADSARVAQAIYEQLFTGIKLDDKHRKIAFDQITDTRRKQHALLPITSNDQFKEYVALQAQRDSVLRLLLPAGATRSRFDRNAKAMWPKSSLWSGS